MKNKILAWIISVQKYIYVTLLFLCVLLIVFIKGCSYGKGRVKCPEIITNTVIVHDTLIHQITDTFPYFIQGKEKIVYRDTGTYHIVDTAFILRDYFATHITDNRYQDSLVQVDLKMYISENKLNHSVFKYRILRDQVINYTTVDNSVNYNRYTYFGISMPVYTKQADFKHINYLGVEVVQAMPKGYAKITYQPYAQIVSVGLGMTILKFRK